MWEVSGLGPGCQSIGVVTYEAMTSQCKRSVVQVLIVTVDIAVVTYEAMTPQCKRSVVQVLIVRVDIGVLIYESMTPQCGWSVVQVLVVRVDIGVMIYEAMTPCVGGQWFRSWLSEYIGVMTYEAMTPQCERSVVQVLAVRVDIEVVIYESQVTPVWEVSGLGPGWSELI